MSPAMQILLMFALIITFNILIASISALINS